MTNVITGIANLTCPMSNQAPVGPSPEACPSGWYLAPVDIFGTCCCAQPVPRDKIPFGCPNQQLIDYCPVLGGVEAFQVVQTGEGPCHGPTCSIVCSYNISDFKTANQINAYKATYTSADEVNQLNTKLLPLFCQGVSGDCPSYPGVGTPRACSRIVSTGPEGQVCQEWAVQDQYNSAIEGVMNNYCSGRHTENTVTWPECLCVSRAFDQLYQDLAINQPTEDVCWWIPCKNPSTFLVPPSLTADAPSCNNVQICQQVIESYNNNNINVDFPDAHFYIDCFGVNPNGGGGDDFFAWIKRNIWIVAGVILLVLVIVAVIVIYFVYFRPKSTAKGKPVVQGQTSKPVTRAEGSKPVTRAEGSKPVTRAEGSKPVVQGQTSKPVTNKPTIKTAIRT
jgi:hypothetical protein